MEGSTVSIYGAITSASELEQAVLATLQKWFPTYLVEYELQAGLIPDNTTPPKHPLPKAWLTADQLDRSAADALPAVVAVSPGLTRNRPEQEGDGSFRVFFSLGVGIFVSGNTRGDTINLVRVYTAIIRTIMLQQQSLGGVADGMTWLDESYDDNFPFTDDQTMSAGQVVFEVTVAGVVNRFAGPTTVDPLPTQPGSDWPLAETVLATVEPEE